MAVSLTCLVPIGEWAQGMSNHCSQGGLSAQPKCNIVLINMSYMALPAGAVPMDSQQAWVAVM